MRHALLRRTADAQETVANNADASADDHATRAIGLACAVLICSYLLGRRYIDPGSGSFAIQIIIAAVLGGLLTARLWLRHMFWRVFGRLRRSHQEDQPTGEEADR